MAGNPQPVGEGLDREVPDRGRWLVRRQSGSDGGGDQAAEARRQCAGRVPGQDQRLMLQPVRPVIQEVIVQRSCSDRKLVVACRCASGPVSCQEAWWQAGGLVAASAESISYTNSADVARSHRWDRFIE